ncbi:MAG: flagellar biosynthesis protein FlhB [Phycisphaerae bacterium]
MAEESNDGGEKSEAPTPQRRRQAREEGNVAKSQDLNAAAVIVGVMIILWFYGGGLLATMSNVMRSMFGAEQLASYNLDTLKVTVVSAVFEIVWAMMPVLIGVATIAVLINIVQVGLMLVPKKLKPQLSSLSPKKGLKRLFGENNGPVKLFMNLMKLIIVGGICYWAAERELHAIVLLPRLEIGQIFGFTTQLIFWMTIKVGVVLLILAILDYAYQRFRHEKQLKMTKQQIKDEMKKMEGDPYIKQRRRQIQMQQSMNRIRSAVPTADVVVTNPTHFAVALKYDADSMRAPRVVAKGADHLAFRVREQAMLHGVPIVERPPLARALFRMVDVGQEVPEEFYSAIAEILAYVYEVNGKTLRAAG